MPKTKESEKIKTYSQYRSRYFPNSTKQKHAKTYDPKELGTRIADKLLDQLNKELSETFKK